MTNISKVIWACEENNKASNYLALGLKGLFREKITQFGQDYNIYDIFLWLQMLK